VVDSRHVCGIVGWLGEAPFSAERLEQATQRLHHRGPDDGGTWSTERGRVAFGHRRLSILDLSSAGHQPFVTSDGRHAIVYNGEVYNFEALRRELEALGHRFRSRCDTEVILEGYRAWGDSVVQRLRGMFAFAIWDAPRHRLFLARDRLGIKPLYYHWDGRTFAFASELKAFDPLPALDFSVDDTALFDFLTYLYIPAPKTPYQRIRKLAPGHTLGFLDGRVLIERYWDVDFHRVGPRRTEADAVAALRDVLADAVNAHLVADVPVGCLLSGGVDSSGVAALATRSGVPLRTYSIGFDDASDDETPFAREVANAIGARHTEARVSLTTARGLTERIPEWYDEPFGDTSAIPTFMVSQVARKDVKVALSGDGGDEVFGGYESYARHRRRARFPSLPSAFRGWLPDRLARSPLMRLRGGATLVDGLRGELERHVAILGGFTAPEKRRYLAAGRRWDGYDDYWYFRQHWREDLDQLSRLQYLDLKTYLPDDILTKVDRASMAVSLEVRPPLLDHLLVEHVAALPVALRNPGGALKHLLKRALEGLVPPSVLTRRKRGFSIPLARWADDLLGHDARGLTPMQRWLEQSLHRFHPARGQA
jgi:asparagine synthase (glutamine-hydrolysing)